jgi:hypothetical protein
VLGISGFGINTFDNGRNPIGGVPCNKGLGKNWIERFLKESELKLQFFICKVCHYQ